MSSFVQLRAQAALSPALAPATAATAQGKSAESALSMPGHKRVKDLEDAHVRQLLQELAPLVSAKTQNAIDLQRVHVSVLSGAEFSPYLRNYHAHRTKNPFAKLSAGAQQGVVAFYIEATKTVIVGQTKAQDMSWDKLRSALFRPLVRVAQHQAYPEFFTELDGRVTKYWDAVKKNKDGLEARRAKASLEARTALLHGHAHYLHQRVKEEQHFPAQRSYRPVRDVLHNVYTALHPEERKRSASHRRVSNVFVEIEQGKISPAFGHHAFTMPVLADRYLGTAEHVSHIPHSAVGTPELA